MYPIAHGRNCWINGQRRDRRWPRLHIRDANAQANYIFKALGGDSTELFPANLDRPADRTPTLEYLHRASASVVRPKNIRDDVENRCPAIRAPRLFGCDCSAPQPPRHPRRSAEGTPPRAPANRTRGASPGKRAAHAINEAAWAAAYAKAQSPVYWLGMTSVTGPSEAWFLTRHDSFAAFEKDDASTESNPALLAERDRLAGHRRRLVEPHIDNHRAVIVQPSATSRSSNSRTCAT